MEPIQPITREVAGLCDHCDQLIEAYLAGLSERPGSIGRYESETEYFTLMKLMLRHLEGVTALARNDLILAPSANVIARTIFETSVRARWMFLPIDPYEREVRWILFLRTGTEQAKKLAKSPHLDASTAKAFKERADTYSRFDQGILEKLFELGYTVPKQAPNLWEMLKDLAEPEFYNQYVLLSADAHSNFEAASRFKSNLGTAKVLGERTSPGDWGLPFQVAWQAFYLAAYEFLKLVEANLESFNRAADPAGFQKKIHALVDPPS